MRLRGFRARATVAGVFLIATACSGGGSSNGGSSSAGAVSSATPKQGGILRIGTTSYIDTLNPYNYIESQATNAMNMIYPQLVQYTWSKASGFQIEGDWAKSWETSADGKDWTFHLIPGGTWSDGKPLTAADAAWSITTTVKYSKGP